jgi:hypothetical protein
VILVLSINSVFVQNTLEVKEYITLSLNPSQQSCSIQLLKYFPILFFSYFLSIFITISLMNVFKFIYLCKTRSWYHKPQIAYKTHNTRATLLDSFVDQTLHSSTTLPVLSGIGYPVSILRASTKSLNSFVENQSSSL